MRSLSNIVGGIGSSGTGNIGHVLYRYGTEVYEFEWRSLAEVQNGGLTNGSSSITIPNNDEDILYDVGAGFVHRFKIDDVDIGTWSASALSLSTLFSVVSGEENSDVSTARATNALFDGAVQELSVNRAASQDFDFLRCVSEAGTFPDVKMKIDGEGRIHSDNPVIVSGADYAEMFEWEDGNPNNEDRIGISVKLLVGGKIAVAEKGEVPFGAISHRPTVLGDSAAMYWQGKYVKDEYGRPTNKVSKEYDPDLGYSPRLDRKEYAIVGCLGKIAVRNDQVINSNWIAIKPLSDVATLYWVR